MRSYGHNNVIVDTELCDTLRNSYPFVQSETRFPATEFKAEWLPLDTTAHDFVAILDGKASKDAALYTPQPKTAAGKLKIGDAPR
jgi:hypothetical protein